MAYENKIAIESCIKKVHKEQGTIEKAESIINEIEEVYFKAKILDRIIGIVKSGRSLGSDTDSEIILRAIEHELKYMEGK